MIQRQIFILVSSSSFYESTCEADLYVHLPCGPQIFYFQEKHVLQNFFPTCVIKQKQLLYSPLASAWDLLNAASKAHSMNISFSHGCWNLLAKYVLFHTSKEKRATYMNRQFTAEPKQTMDTIRKHVKLP